MAEWLSRYHYSNSYYLPGNWTLVEFRDLGIQELKSESFPYLNPSIFTPLNLFVHLFNQGLNPQFLNLARYSHYDKDSVQKKELFFRSNIEPCSYTDLFISIPLGMPIAFYI